MNGHQRSVGTATTLLSLVLAAGCGSVRGAEGADAPGPTASQIITREQIMESNGRNAWDVLRSTVRYIHWGVGSAGVPQRATRRGTTSGQGPDQVRVMLNGVTVVNLSDLTLVATRDLQEIRVLSGVEATTYFGTNSVAGAVLITTIASHR